MTRSQLILSMGNKPLKKPYLAVKTSLDTIHMALMAKNLEPECSEVLNQLLTALAFAGQRKHFFFHFNAFFSSIQCICNSNLGSQLGIRKAERLIFLFRSVKNWKGKRSPTITSQSPVKL